MKAVMYLGKGKVGVCDIEKPVCPPDEVMVKIEYCALCATDVHLVTNGLFGVTDPLTLGHEMSGTVVEVDLDKGAHVIQFDDMPTPRRISFRARLERE